MSVHVSARAWLVQGLTFAEKLVLVKLADMASDEGVCWPSTATLGAQCGLDRRSVRRIIARLEAAGHVSRKPRFNDKGLSVSNWLTVLPPDDRRAASPDDFEGDRPALPRGAARSYLGGTARPSKPSTEPSLNLQARDVREVVASLTAYQRSSIRRGASVLIGRCLVAPGSSEFSALASALSADEGAGL